MVTNEEFRQMALSLSDTVELPHFDRASFRVYLPGRQAGKRIFATLSEKDNIAVLMLSPLQQSVFCAFDKTIIYPVAGGWGLKGATVFELGKMKKRMMKDTLKVVYDEIKAKH